jgi:hypothetical protein
MLRQQRPVRHIRVKHNLPVSNILFAMPQCQDGCIAPLFFHPRISLSFNPENSEIRMSIFWIFSMSRHFHFEIVR